MAGVHPEAGGVPTFAKAVSLALGEAADVATSVGVGHYATAVTLVGGVALSHVGFGVAILR